MCKRITIAFLVVILVVAKIEGWLDGNEIFAVVAVVFLGYASFRSFCTMKGRTELRPEDDDDGGIDWRENDEGVAADVTMIDGWAVLVDDCAVFEAKEVAQRLEESGIRCRVEAIHEDRSFHYYGHGGLGTRMCVLVPPSEYERVKEITKVV